MRLSKWGYYADFVIYPVVIAVLGTASLDTVNARAAAAWAGALLVGTGTWTLLEYWLHRIALHRTAYLASMHALHHRAPQDYVGTPTWLSLAVLIGFLLLPIWHFVGFPIASGLTAGVMIGYLWYGLTHHWIHHARGGALPRYLERRRVRHLRHHYSPKRGNYGVTTAFWDRVFGTLIHS